MRKTVKTGWYVLYVGSCQEKKVHNLLVENKIESFLPIVKTTRQWSDRKKVISTPLFPSYVFVKINSTKDFSRVLSFKGVCSYIQFGTEYAIVKESEILQIKLFIGSEDITDIKTSNDSFKIGEIKKINYGSLTGLECEILRVNENHKLLVRIESLRQNITATIPSYYLSELSLAG